MNYNPFLPETQAAAAPACMGVVTSTTGGLYVRVDAGTQARKVSYKRLSSYTPAEGDRVLMIRISGTYVVLGKVV